jgi:hypothetical protein
VLSSPPSDVAKVRHTYGETRYLHLSVSITHRTKSDASANDENDEFCDPENFDAVNLLESLADGNLV